MNPSFRFAGHVSCNDTHSSHSYKTVRIAWSLLIKVGQPLLRIIYAAISLIGSVPTPYLAPSSAWHVDYGEDICLAARSYPGEDGPVTLGFDPGQTGHAATMIVVGRPARTHFNVRLMKVSFREGEPATEVQGTERAAGIKSQMKLTIPLAQAQVDQLLKSEQLRIDYGSDVPFSLLVPGAKAAFAALETCRIDLVRRWGMSVEDQARLAVPAKLSVKSLGALFDFRDYPTDALRKSEQGLVRVRVRVGADGRASNCTVTHPIGSTSLEATTCAVILHRARYKPALDHEGHPMASLDTAEISWMIPSN